MLVSLMSATGGFRLWGGEKSAKRMRYVGTALYINMGREDSSGVTGRYKRSTMNKPTINLLTVTSNINARFATTSIQSTMTNTESLNQEANFIVQIPETAFISNYTMYIDGSWFVAEVKEKKLAEEEYEEAVKQNKTAGMVSSDERLIPERGMEFFTVSVNVRPNSEVKFELEYLELMNRKHGVFEQRISVRPQQIVEELGVEVHIFEPQGIKFIDVVEPASGTNSVANIVADITHTSANVKEVSYFPTVAQQMAMNATVGINGDLIVRYDTEHPYDAGLIQFEDDYFVHFFSPTDPSLVPLSKNVIFVIDISGSMSGEKMKQTRDSMQVILTQLRREDKFMMLLFDNELEYWPSNKLLIEAHGDNIAKGQKFAKDKLYAKGGTDINSALLEASNILKVNGEAGANMIVFLTDGEPTSGVTSRSQIISNVAEASAGKVAIFSLGYGYSLDFDLLAAVAYQTGGFAKRIYEDVDAAVQLESFFSEVNTPLAYNVEVVYETNEVDFSSLTKYKFPQYFNGSEIIVTGKMKKSAPKTLNTKVIFVTHEQIELPKVIDTSVQMEIPQEAIAISRPGFLERLYVYMKIKDLLLEKLITDEKRQVEIENFALQLALDYNLVTPLTSMIIVEPDRPPSYDRESHGAFDPSGASNNKVMWSMPSSVSQGMSLTPPLLIMTFTLFYYLLAIIQTG